MSFDVAMTAEVNAQARSHLLQHFGDGSCQEDLCFALWRPSTGEKRHTALIYQIILPKDDDRELHGNASFQPNYLARSIELAREEQAGLAFMHSHPSRGWQGMSGADVVAERDVLAYPTGATGLPLVGLTVGMDGYWSARFWEAVNGKKVRRECEKVRVVGPASYQPYFDDRLVPRTDRREVLKRTIDTWGDDAQQRIARLRVGIVGLGSVGCVVAEAVARIGISRITLIDHDLVERHNLDRLLFATEQDIGKRKVDVAKQRMLSHATAKRVEITVVPLPIQNRSAYKMAIDCDLLFSCVDRPIPRDVLNHIAYVHLVPVIDGGVAIETMDDQLHSAHWRTHVIAPHNQCMRCIGQFNTSDVLMELNGSLDNSSYIANLPAEQRMGNQNVFPFALSVAAMEVNLMLRYLLARDWWPVVPQQDYRFVTGDIRITKGHCHPGCEFPQRLGMGDAIAPSYLVDDTSAKRISHIPQFFSRLSRALRTLWHSRR